MFISAIHYLPEKISENQRLKEERVVFTEIDYNYVNPVSDNYQIEINEAMPDISDWNLDWEQSYKSSYDTFNEYMTWSVFNIYLMQNYPESDFLKANSNVVYQMEQGRGFILFEEFNSMLLELYVNKSESEKIIDLYPQILNWVKSKSAEL